MLYICTYISKSVKYRYSECFNDIIIVDSIDEEYAIKLKTDLTNISKIKNIAEKNSSIFVPVRMHLHDENEHLARIQKPERKLRFKTTDPSDLEKGKNLIDITDNNLLDLDITGLSTKKIVEKIMRFTESLNN